jgi:hypothetical protein
MRFVPVRDRNRVSESINSTKDGSIRNLRGLELKGEGGNTNAEFRKVSSHFEELSLRYWNEVAGRPMLPEGDEEERR